MSEGRKQKRKKTSAFFGVNDQSTNSFVGWVVDMSTEGLRLRSKAEIEIDSAFLFRIDLPFEINESNEIVFNAMSIWSSEVDCKNEYNTGFKLIDVAIEEIAKIEEFIESSHFEDGDELIPVTLHKLST